MRPEKVSIVAEIRRDLSASDFVVLADFRGLKVEESNDLRRRLEKAGARMKVVKNRLFRWAVRELPWASLEQALKGPSAMVYGRGDLVEVARVLRKFIQEHERPVIKLGAMGGRVFSESEVRALADLPPRPVLCAQLVGALASPLIRLVGVLRQPLAQLVGVLKAAEEKRKVSS